MVTPGHAQEAQALARKRRVVFSGVDDRAPIREFLEAVVHGVLDLSLHLARHRYRVGVARAQRVSALDTSAAEV